MASQCKDIRNYLKPLDLLQSSKERVVLPSVGKTQNVLFWTITEDNQNSIRRLLIIGIENKDFTPESSKQCFSFKYHESRYGQA